MARCEQQGHENGSDRRSAGRLARDRDVGDETDGATRRNQQRANPERGREQQADHGSIAASGAQHPGIAHGRTDRSDGLAIAHLAREGFEDDQGVQREQCQRESGRNQHQPHVDPAHEREQGGEDDEERRSEKHGSLSVIRWEDEGPRNVPER